VAAQDQVLPHLGRMHLALAVRHERTRVLPYNADSVAAISIESILIFVSVILIIILVGVSVYDAVRSVIIVATVAIK